MVRSLIATRPQGDPAGSDRLGLPQVLGVHGLRVTPLVSGSSPSGAYPVQLADLNGQANGLVVVDGAAYGFAKKRDLCLLPSPSAPAGGDGWLVTYADDPCDDILPAPDVARPRRDGAVYFCPSLVATECDWAVPGGALGALLAGFPSAYQAANTLYPSAIP